MTDKLCMADLARDLGLPLIVVARAALGTINHTLLTLEVADEWRRWEEQTAAPGCKLIEPLCMLSIRRDLERMAGRAVT